ncbi:MAG TPA: histidine kinase [Flavobacterium sp.]|nr:histidine kinase [Flavobacterium sp.]
MLKTTNQVVLFFCCFIFFSTSAQDKTIDSLKRVIQNPKLHDTTKLAAIAVASDLYNQGDPTANYLNGLIGKLALKNYRETQSPELRKKYAMYVGAYYNNLGNVYSDNRDVLKAWSFYDQSIRYFKLAEAPYEMNYVVVGKGIFLSKINENEKAISCLFSALKFYETDKKEYQDGIIYVQSSLATIYENQGRHDESIKYNEKVIRYFDHKRNMTAEDNSRKGLAFSNCGSSYFEMKKYPEAMDNYNKALLLFKKIEQPLYINIVLARMARVKMRESKFDDAEAFLKEALAGADSDLAIANTYIKLGELFYLKKDMEKADYYLTRGLSLSKKEKNLELQTQAAELLFKVSIANKNFKKALDTHLFYDRLIDSGKIETSRNALAQQEIRYAFEKKELNYKLDTAQKNATKNNWLIFLSSALLLVLSGSYFYYRNNRQKQAIAVLEKNQIKQKLLITQMNPHFIFNSIENIQGLIYDKQNDAAVDYLNKFSALTRQILEHSNENYISLSEELDMIKNYLSIQQLLHNNKFDFKITIDDTIDTHAIFLPPMLTQPFIENAIKHGLSNKITHGEIGIRFYFEEAKLFFEVSDNGKGFDAQQKANSHKSLAMTITKERLVNYTKNQHFVVQANNILDDDTNVLGAKVIFEIPYIYEN